MFFVRATVSGVWRSVDVVDHGGYKLGEKALIMCLEAGRWSVDGRPVEVQPGLAVSFRDPNDAQWFLDQRRASIITVEPESVVMFESEIDAQFYVRSGLGELMSNREVEAIFAEASAQQMQSVPQDDEPVEGPEKAAKSKRKKAKT